MSPEPIVTRFAPSPTGLLHLGGAYAALVAWRRARAVGGRFLLRIEDIDPERCRPEFATAIADDLRWLGIDWDGTVRRQSEHLAEYRAVIETLARRGLAYPCFCSRAEIEREVAASLSAPHDPDGAPLYPGTCRRRSPADRKALREASAPHAWRLDVTRAMAEVGRLTYVEDGEGIVTCAPDRFGDALIGRRHVPASYHLCVTHDDAEQGVTLVTRARDLRPATDLHRLLQALMGWPAPTYAHHALLTDASGRRLAKRDRSVTLEAMRQGGATPNDVIDAIDAALATSG